MSVGGGEWVPFVGNAPYHEPHSGGGDVLFACVSVIPVLYCTVSYLLADRLSLQYPIMYRFVVISV